VSHSFRIRFKRSPTDTVQTESNELELSSTEDAGPLKLLNPDSGQPILKATELVLTQSGYTSAESAHAAGEKAQRALMLALARQRIGANFGSRSPKGLWTAAGLSWLEGQIGQRVLNSTHGLMVFTTDPKPRFALMQGDGLRGVDPGVFQQTFHQSVQVERQPTERDFVALELFNASFFQRSGDSRFLLLMMAIEALLAPPLRSEPAQDHVRQLIKQTKESPLAKKERDSMIGSLRWLLRESISQTGRMLVEQRLGEREYCESQGSDFFVRCYQLRSNLVHGNLPYPTFEDIASVVGQLEVMVADLITAPFLGPPQ